MNVAIIPARGGSKRIPRKNIKNFGDLPMIAYAIKAALNSQLFDKVVVSTDDQEIAEISRQYGALTPFIRPSELSDDYTPTVPVIAHAIGTCRSLGWDIQYACCIYAAVPFIQVDDLVSSFDLLKKSDADYCFPIAEFPAAIQRSLKLDEQGRTLPFFPEHELTRTQDLEATYYDAGQFYWGSTKSWLTNHHIHRSGVGFPIPSWRVVDIDTPDDWMRAQNIWHALNDHLTA
jgi:pseudaminic acid cytidylyltransferase